MKNKMTSCTTMDRFALVSVVALVSLAVASLAQDLEEELSPSNGFGDSWSMSVESSAANPSAIDALGVEQEHGFLVGSRRSQLAPGHSSKLKHTVVRRQVSYPQLSEQFAPQFQPQQQQAPAQQEQNGVFKFFQDLGPQVERAKAISNLFGAVGGANNNGTAPASQTFNPGQLMGQLSELIRSTQDRNAKMLESTQRSVDQAGQQTATAARQAQGGIQSALTEMGQGLMKMASNNPNLLPDIKNLYQSVSTKLSSASTSVAQAAGPQKNGAEQFAEQLAKAGQQA